MTTKRAFSLKKGDKVFHKHIGNSTVMGMIPKFGPTIVPDTNEGKFKLAYLSGMPPGTPFLASDYKTMLKEVDNTEPVLRVYVIQDNETMIINGCFRKKEKADSYVNNSPNLTVVELSAV